MHFRHGVVCCDSKTCKSELFDKRAKNDICQERKTFDEAQKICQDSNMRLCSNEELTYERKCCDSNCRDSETLWFWVSDMSKYIEVLSIVSWKMNLIRLKL